MTALDKVAWITGGTRGLGGHLARALGPEYRLALSYRADDRSARSCAAKIVDSGQPEPLLLRGDLSADGVARAQIDRILDLYGRLDGLVHSAALATFKPAHRIAPREMRRTMSYSFEAFHQVAFVAIPALVESRGAIVAISSLGARRAISSYAGLGPAKAAVESYVRHLAADLGTRGVRANVVSPGILATSSLPRLGIGKEARAEIAGRTPLKRLVSMAEVAAVVSFLLSGAASGVTGQTITVDAGYDVVA